MKYAYLTLLAMLVSGAVFAGEKRDAANNEQPIHAPVNPDAVKKSRRIFILLSRAP